MSNRNKAPLKIAFIGAPSSGKSKIARAVAKESEQLLGHKPVIVDDYVKRLQKDTDLALGPFASYSENFMVAGTRYAAEFKAMKKGISVFTVGTIIESFLYQAMVADIELQRTDPQAALRAAETAMGGMGLILAETLGYDAIIYLPFVQKGKEENYWSKMVDEHIQTVTFSFSIPISIVEGTTNERISKSKKVVEFAYEAAPEVTVSF